MKKLEIDERKQFVALLIHHMMYSDEKYLYILELLNEWESETPTTSFDFSYNEMSKLQIKKELKQEPNRKNRK